MGPTEVGRFKVGVGERDPTGGTFGELRFLPLDFYRGLIIVQYKGVDGFVPKEKFRRSRRYDQLCIKFHLSHTELMSFRRWWFVSIRKY